MIEIAYNKQDKRYLFLTCDNTRREVKIKGKTRQITELQWLEMSMNLIPEHQFLPSFKGIPTPVVFLHKLKKDDKTYYWCHSGLWHEIEIWCKEHNVKLKSNIDDEFKYIKLPDNKESFAQWVKDLDLSLELRDYQITAAWKILNYKMSMSQLATRSGKTLIAYVVFRYMVEKLGAKNILMIVPNISLVKQGVEDFKKYKEFFDIDQVWAKAEYCTMSNLTIGTFQSLVRRIDKKSKKYDPKFFDKFDVILCDECHKAACKSIDLILKQPFIKNAKIRFGFSGTIPSKGSIDNLTCQSLIGPMIQDISSKELIDSGYLADVDITQYRIHYNWNDDLINDYKICGEYLCSNYKEDENGKRILKKKEERLFLMQHEKELPFALKKLYKEQQEELKKVERSKTNNLQEIKLKYVDYLIDLCKANGSNLLLLEQMVMFMQEKKINILKEVLRLKNGNYIVFAHHTEWLKYLESRLKEEMPDKKILLITGTVNQKKREKIMKTMEENNDCILLASYACVGTGLTFKNVEAGVFAESFKSQIINKQSLGRGLLLAPGKDRFYLYDLIDCFPTRRLEFQGNAKKSLFTKEGYDVIIENR